MPAQLPRLIDLHCDWILQYATETTVFDPKLYEGTKSRVGQADGYLNATSAAIFSCYRRAGDWKGQADPWRALDALITRIEAEFSGRLLIGPEDHARWIDDPDGLAWGLIGVEGFDFLVRDESGLGRLKPLFERGVRLFQPVYGSSSLLGGSSEVSDDRGLTPLGARFIETLATLAATEEGPRPILDLAHLNPRTMSDVLDLLEGDASKRERLLLAYSHGALAHEHFATPRAITLDNLKRLRALGGTVGVSVGPPFYLSIEQFKAGIEAIAEGPFLGESGLRGIAIGTDFLGVDQTLPGLSNASEVVTSISGMFGADGLKILVESTAKDLINTAVGVRQPAA